MRQPRSRPAASGCTARRGHDDGALGGGPESIGSPCGPGRRSRTAAAGVRGTTDRATDDDAELRHRCAPPARAQRAVWLPLASDDRRSRVIGSPSAGSRERGLSRCAARRSPRLSLGRGRCCRLRRCWAVCSLRPVSSAARSARPARGCFSGGLARASGRLVASRRVRPSGGAGWRGLGRLGGSGGGTGGFAAWAALGVRPCLGGGSEGGRRRRRRRRRRPGCGGCGAGGGGGGAAAAAVGGGRAAAPAPVRVSARRRRRRRGRLGLGLRRLRLVCGWAGSARRLRPAIVTSCTAIGVSGGSGRSEQRRQAEDDQRADADDAAPPRTVRAMPAQARPAGGRPLERRRVRDRPRRLSACGRPCAERWRRLGEPSAPTWRSATSATL